MTLLDTFAGKPFEAVVADLRDVLEDAEYPTVKRWREGGGKVLGHFQVYFPEEIAHAILFLLSDEASYTTGAFIDCGGGR